MTEGDDSEAKPKRRKRKRKAKRAGADPKARAAPPILIDEPKDASARWRLLHAVAGVSVAQGVGARVAAMLGAGSIAAGLALVGTRASETGMYLWLGGVLLLAGAIHRLGRLGPDGPPHPS